MGDIVIKKEDTLQVAKKFGTQIAIKPLEKEVFLKDLYVQEVMTHSEKLLRLKIGDALDLKREPQPYDNLIVAVYSDDTRLGVIADFEEEIIAHLLDAGKRITAKVKHIVNIPEYSSLEISVSMIDF